MFMPYFYYILQYQKLKAVIRNESQMTKLILVNQRILFLKNQ